MFIFLFLFPKTPLDKTDFFVYNKTKNNERFRDKGNERNLSEQGTATFGADAERHPARLLPETGTAQ